MKMKKSHRILSMLLAVSLALSMIGGLAFAEDSAGTAAPAVVADSGAAPVTKADLTAMVNDLRTLDLTSKDAVLEKQDAIRAAKDAYDALTAEDRAAFNESAEKSRLNELSEALAKYLREDRPEITSDDVGPMLDALTGVTLSDRVDMLAAKAKIVAALKAYRDLTDGEKNYLTEEQRAFAEKLNDALKAYHEKSVTPAEIEELIARLTETANNGEIPDADAVKAARAAYDALTDEEKAAFDPDTFALLVMLEGALAAMPVVMADDGIPLDDSVTALESGRTYSVATAAQLNRLAALMMSQPENGGYTVNLLNDIQADENFTAIGNYTYQFKGIFDGGNHVVTFAITDVPKNDFALFSYVHYTGTVKNVGVAGTVSGEITYGAGVVRTNQGGTVENCYNTATFTSTANGQFLGGVVGNNSNGTVKNCYNIGSVTGKFGSNGGSLGGVIGYNSGTVENCHNTGAVTREAGIKSRAYVGGVVGNNDTGGKVLNCYNTGAVTGIEDLGGVVGVNYSTVKNCYNTGSVTGTKYLGGVVGDNLTGGSVQDCVSLGLSVTSTDNSSTIGRIIGNSVAGSTLSGNRARNDMLVNDTVPTSSDAGSINGEDVAVDGTVAQNSAVFAGWDTSLWNIPTGNLGVGTGLPTLNNITASQNPTLPGTAVTTPAITITLNSDAPVGGTSLSDAVTKALKGADANTITSLEITAGEVTGADWKALKAALPALRSFYIKKDLAVTNVAGIPDAQRGTPIFPKSIDLVQIPQAITVGDYAFNNCTALKDVYLYAATDIGAYAFDGCGELSSVALLAAKNIGEGAFNGCTRLGWLKLGTTVPKLASTNAFTSCPTPRDLVIADANGAELTENTNPKLSVVAAAYDKVVAPDTGTDIDGLWYGWEVREPIVASWAATGGGTGQDTLENAVKAVKATGGTVTLLTNVEDPVAVDINEEFTKPVTLVLNGKTLNGMVLATGNTGAVTVDGTVAGSKIQSVMGYPAIHCTNPNLKLKGGTYVGDTATSTPAIIMFLESNDPGGVAKLKTLLADGYKYENENGFTVTDVDGQPAAITGNTVTVVPTVSVAVTGVTLNKTALTLEAGKNEALVATVAPSNATNKAVTWKSSAAAVASVDTTGKITAVKAGTATITVTTTDGGKTATCAVTVTAPTTKPAPGGKLEAPLTQGKVDGVFGEGNATLDNTSTPPKITIDNSITPEKPIEIETDVTIDLGGNTITGKPGQPPIIVGDGDKVNIGGSGSVAGGDNSSGAGGSGITGGTGSEITIGKDVTVEGGNGTTGGNGIQSGGNVTVGGSVSGGDGSSGAGGSGVDTSGGTGNVTVSSGGSANGGKGGSGSAGGNGTTTGSGGTIISNGGSTSGGTGGSSSSGAGGPGGSGSASTGNGSIEVGGSATGGNGGSGATGGTGGNGTATGGSTTVDGGGSATGGTGGSGSIAGGNGGNGASSGSTTISKDGEATGGSGGSGATGSNGNGGNGGNGVHQGTGTVGDNGTATGGNGGSGAGTGSGGAGGKGVGGGATAGGDLKTKDGISAKVEVVGNANTEVKLPDPAKTVDAVLTDAEKADAKITDVKVTLKVDDKTAAKPDQAAVESKKPANSVIGAFFDITLQKTVTKNNVAGNPEAVTDVPNGDITITIEIPSAMRGGSGYVIIRVHTSGGATTATLLNDTDNDPDTITFETNQFSTYAIAYTPAGTNPDPGPGPSPNPGPSGGSSGSSSSNDGYDFWMSVKEKIQKADAGDVVKVNAKGYDKMPRSVMDTLRKNSGVSLVITWNGKTITIPAGKAQKSESKRIYWPLSRLAELYADVAEDTVLKPAEGTNPETGGPGNYIPVTGGGELITLEAPSVMEKAIPDATENTQTIATAQPKTVTPPDAGFEQDAFAGTPDAKAVRGVSAATVACFTMLLAVLCGGGILLWKRRKEK